VLHTTCTHQGRVDSRLLMVRSQTGNLTSDLSFIHNLCCRCFNGSYKANFDICTSRPFQRYKEHLKARCFDPYNWILSFQESWRTPKSPFRECECHLHTPSKWGCHMNVLSYLLNAICKSMIALINDIIMSHHGTNCEFIMCVFSWLLMNEVAKCIPKPSQAT
jgi:hypothetical protein